MTLPALEPSLSAQAERDRAQRLKAIGLMCLSVSVLAGLDATVKYLVGPGGIPVLQVAAMRLGIHLLLFLALIPVLLGPRQALSAARTRKPVLQMARSLFMFGATIFNFLALRYLQLDQTITFFFATPLIVAALAGPLLGEWVGWRRLLAIVTGFVGVVVVTRPGFGGIHWAVVFSFAAITCAGLYNIATRYLARFDANEVTMFYTPIAGVLLILPFAAVDWVWPHSAFIWLLLFAVGFLGGLGHWLLIVAHRWAPAPVLAPFIYTNLLVAVVLGYGIFGDLPNAWTLTGGLIVIASGLYLFNRERSGVSARPQTAVGK